MLLSAKASFPSARCVYLRLAAQHWNVLFSFSLACPPFQRQRVDQSSPSTLLLSIRKIDRLPQRFLSECISIYYYYYFLPKSSIKMRKWLSEWVSELVRSFDRAKGKDGYLRLVKMDFWVKNQKSNELNHVGIIRGMKNEKKPREWRHLVATIT